MSNSRSRLPQIIATVIFGALITVPIVLQRRQNTQTPSAPDQSGALKRYGFSLTEASQKAGIDFKHQAPKLDAKLDHIMPQVASMGAGVAIGDFDRDGWDDIYLTNSAQNSLNRLYRNRGDGTFEDVAGALGVADVNRFDGDSKGTSMGAVWGDYDNDGWEDLLIYKWGKPELFHNDAGKKFSRATETSGLPNWVNANNAIWFDYDRDGKLDIFIGGYYAENVNLWKLTTTRIMPDSLEYARNGTRKYLLHGMGNGKFEDVTQKMGLDSKSWTLAAVAADLRGTGYPDLFIANDYGVAELWANQGGKKFVNIGKDSGVGYAPKSGMNAAVGDVMNNGNLAVYVSNISEPGVLLQGNNLWMPNPGTKGNGVKYQNLAHEMGVEDGGWSFGAQFGDLNNDGHLDLFLANGYVSGDKSSYWYDYSKVAGGNSSIISDAANWPPMNNRNLSGNQAKHLWINDGNGNFTEVAQAVGATDRFDGRAVALADFRNNGALDIVESNQRGPLQLYRNTVADGRDWIEFALEGAQSNRSAIGAQIVINWKNAQGEQQQKQEISGGSGFCAQNSRRIHFGLGKNAKIEKIQIRWPLGQTQNVEAMAVNQLHKIKETL